MYAPNIELQYEAFLEEVEVALGKATSSEFLVLLDFHFIKSLKTEKAPGEDDIRPEC